jgi:DnaJ-class molecular chaperone
MERYSMQDIAQSLAAQVALKDQQKMLRLTCPDCNGDGVVEKGTDDEQQCPTCGGSGFVPDDDDDDEVTRTASS